MKSTEEGFFQIDELFLSKKCIYKGLYLALDGGFMIINIYFYCFLIFTEWPILSDAVSESVKGQKVHDIQKQGS